MKITNISARWLRVPLDPPLADSLHTLKNIDWIIVEVRAGDYAGQSIMLSFDFAPHLLKAIVDTELSRHLIGEDSTAIRGIFEKNLLNTEYIGQSGLAQWGISAIDTALWDLLGRRLETPVADLLGRYASAVPCYGSGGWLSYSDDEMIANVKAYVKRGFRGVKLKVGKFSVERDYARVKMVREAIGPDIKLMLDANQKLTLDKALSLVKKVEDLDITWLEEPFHKDDLESFVRLANSTPIPIAAGEREFGYDHFRHLVDANAISVVQPDLMRVGGVTGWRQVGALAETHHKRLAPHFYKEYDVHLAAAYPGLVAIEWFDWIDPILVNPLQLDADGNAIVPNRPGFGVEVKQEAIKEFEVKSDKLLVTV